MIKRVPIRDTNNGGTYALEGEPIDILPKDNTIYADHNGKTYDPRDNVQLQQLPDTGVLQLPRTTWFRR
ncbi:MAG TPA: hypothetical protein VLN59_14295 [Burkholderiales bacterium]|nr:hypothetical protein [Burkholderiales bacterium]